MQKLITTRRLTNMFRCANIPAGCQRCDETCSLRNGRSSRFDYWKWTTYYLSFIFILLAINVWSKYSEPLNTARGAAKHQIYCTQIKNTFIWLPQLLLGCCTAAMSRQTPPLKSPWQKQTDITILVASRSLSPQTKVTSRLSLTFSCWWFTCALGPNFQWPTDLKDQDCINNLSLFFIDGSRVLPQSVFTDQSYINVLLFLIFLQHSITLPAASILVSYSEIKKLSVYVHPPPCLCQPIVFASRVNTVSCRSVEYVLEVLWGLILQTK